jgi:hypothetical protein
MPFALVKPHLGRMSLSPATLVNLIGDAAQTAIRQSHSFTNFGGCDMRNKMMIAGGLALSLVGSATSILGATSWMF